MKRPSRRSAPRPKLRVSVTDARGRGIASGQAAGLGRWVARAAPRAVSGVLTIAIVSDTAMRRLNRRYRGHDSATDVLSFVPEPSRAPGTRPRNRRFLGDLAIARGVAVRQARERGHSVRTEFRILALHGLLHLMGYDHEADRGEMGRLEERLRRRAGLPVGLIARR
jgi:probable rRNA maturation factor